MWACGNLFIGDLFLQIAPPHYKRVIKAGIFLVLFLLCVREQTKTPAVTDHKTQNEKLMSGIPSQQEETSESEC